jgi:Na+-translocating ferredoxin:NAD+ oxidoreductase RnfA subunit
MNSSLSLLVLSGLFLNLPVQLGLGIKEIWHEGNKPLVFSAFECLVLFLSIIIQWLLFLFVFSPLNLGFFRYFILFPLSVGISAGFEFLFSLVIQKSNENAKKVFLFPSVSGLSIAAVLLVISLADKAGDALILSFGFSLGVFLSIEILKAIKYRVSNEKISPLFRGLPLILISMGLLSLVWGSAAIIYLSTKRVF